MEEKKKKLTRDHKEINPGVPVIIQASEFKRGSAFTVHRSRQTDGWTEN